MLYGYDFMFFIDTLRHFFHKSQQRAERRHRKCVSHMECFKDVKIKFKHYLKPLQILSLNTHTLEESVAAQMSCMSLLKHFRSGSVHLTKTYDNSIASGDNDIWLILGLLLTSECNL